MNAITVDKAALIQTLKDNRASHATIAAEAKSGYQTAVIAELEDMLAVAKAGAKIKRCVNAIEPMDQTKDYDRAIAMLELSLDTRITLEEQDFQTYVLDEWHWKSRFTASNSSYSKTLSDSVQR